jgi:CheY-like chemotaxis protein
MSKKILIVEDDKFLLNAYHAKFERTDFEVQLASDGEQAITLFKEFKPDVVLLDLIIPKINGFDVLRQIKADPAQKNTPVIVASNLGQKEDLDQAKALGADDFYIKSDSSIESIVEKVSAAVR